MPEFGSDVSFWHRPPDACSAPRSTRSAAGVGRATLYEPSFALLLNEHRRRFEATGTEEGTVMAAVLAYVTSDLRTNRLRAAILDDFRSNGQILDLFKRGVARTGRAHRKPAIGLFGFFAATSAALFSARRAPASVL